MTPSSQRSQPTLSPGQCAQLACLLEATARKAGNVHRAADFADLRYIDFVLSAVAIGPVLDQASELGVGQTVLECVRRTRALVRTNTNLGTVLLLAPLAAVAGAQALRGAVAELLKHLTVADARLVYEAIRLAQPGGLGQVPDQDVSGEPTQDLRTVMRLAADRDLVARQYANGFCEVFDCGVPAWLAAQDAGLDWEHAIIRCHLELMAMHPDTLIARKRGETEAQESAQRAAAVIAAGWPLSSDSQRLFAELDGWLRAVGHQRNPGTTADLVAACLFVALRDGTIKLRC